MSMKSKPMSGADFITLRSEFLVEKVRDGGYVLILSSFMWRNSGNSSHRYRTRLHRMTYSVCYVRSYKLFMCIIVIFTTTLKSCFKGFITNACLGFLFYVVCRSISLPQYPSYLSKNIINQFISSKAHTFDQFSVNWMNNTPLTHAWANSNQSNDFNF